MVINQTIFFQLNMTTPDWKEYLLFIHFYIFIRLSMIFCTLYERCLHFAWYSIDVNMSNYEEQNPVHDF